MAKQKQNGGDGPKQEYFVIHPVMFDGKVQPRRAVLEMTDEEAARPLKAGYIKLLAGN